MASKQKSPPLGVVEGLLECKGSVVPGDGKKWELLWLQVGHGRLFYYEILIDPKRKKDLNPVALKAQAITAEKNLVDIVPLLYMTPGVIDEKRDKHPTAKFSFVFAIESKKWRTSFAVENQEQLNMWLTGFETAIDLAKSNTFGTTINDGCWKANSYTPFVMQETIKHISKSLKTEGLFRVPGDTDLIETYSRQFDDFLVPDFFNKEISLPCSLLKSYIRDLREPLIPGNLFDDFIKVGMNENVKDQISNLKDLIKLLSDVNRHCLYVLCKFLASVAAHSEFNKMDIPNLALVFGPTVLRKIGGGGSAKTEMEHASTTRNIFQLILEHQAQLFVEAQEAELEKANIFQPENDPTFGLAQMNNEERDAISKVIKDHQRGDNIWGCSIFYMVSVAVEKTKIREPKIMVIDLNRVYIFQKGGKVVEHNFHFLEIISIRSESRFHLQITYSSTSLPKQVDIYPSSAGSFDIDNILEWFHRQWELNFVGVGDSHSFKKFEIAIQPPERSQAIFARVDIRPEDQEENCWGFVRSYHSICDREGDPVNEEMLWDIEHFYYSNKITKLELAEFIKQDKYPNRDFLNVCFVLCYNLWFESLVSLDLALQNEGVEKLAQVIKYNSTLTELTMTKSETGRTGLSHLFGALVSNDRMVLKKLDLSGNNIDSKSCPTFVRALRSNLGQLTELHLANAQLNRKSMQAIVEALSNTTSLLSTLLVLDLSQNKLDPDNSRILGIMLAATKALIKLGIADTGIVFQRLADGMTDGTSVKTCKSLQIINLGSNSLKKTQQDMVKFCNLHLPNLNEITLTNNEMTAENLIKLIEAKPNWRFLDISDNELTDEAFISVCQVIGQRPVATLRLSRTLKTGKRHFNATSAIGAMCLSSGISTLQVQGGKSSALKADAATLVLSLLNNPTLTDLDISFNQGGEDLHNAIARIIQYNPALLSMAWEGNDVSLQGFKTIRHALRRNTTLQGMILPVLDLAPLLAPSSMSGMNVSGISMTGQASSESKDVTTMLSLCDEIQKVCSTNCSLKQALPDTLPPAPNGLRLTPEEEALIGRKAIRQNSLHSQKSDLARLHMVFGSGHVDEASTETQPSEEDAIPEDDSSHGPNSQTDESADDQSSQKRSNSTESSKFNQTPRAASSRTLKANVGNSPTTTTPPGAGLRKKPGGSLPKLKSPVENSKES